MIEIQIKDKELYEKLKQNAIYSSDLTQVCSFRDALSDMLKEYSLTFEEEAKIEIKPSICITGRNIMKLDNATSEMLHFVGVRSEMDPTISLRNMNEVRLLIKKGLVETTDSFNALYSKLGYRNKIKELVCANVKFATKGKLTDYIDGDLSLQSMHFADCREVPIIYKQMHLKITSPVEKKDKYEQITATGAQKEEVIIKFYNKPAILKSIAFEGNKISIATSKVIEIRGKLTVVDPIILPSGLEFRDDIMYSPADRKIPIDLYRNAFYEFKYRYEDAKAIEEKGV